MNVTIACPACGQGQIVISPQLLLGGNSFACSCCGSRLSLEPDSQQTYQKGMAEFAVFKRKAQQQKPTARIG